MESLPNAGRSHDARDGGRCDEPALELRGVDERLDLSEALARIPSLNRPPNPRMPYRRRGFIFLLARGDRLHKIFPLSACFASQGRFSSLPCLPGIAQRH